MSAVDGGIVRQYEVSTVAFVTTARSHESLLASHGIVLRGLPKDAKYLSAEAAVSIARHASSAADARSLELDELATARLGLAR